MSGKYLTVRALDISNECGVNTRIISIVVMFVSVLITNYLIMDGKSNWLEGIMLLGTYAIVAVAFFYYPDEETSNSTGH
ncbi:hypothetical protein BDF19DRAFT_386511 [Syncephalis fuscata]|nr:hypothetical protein BDF19DRAFT_386511 [Syncephalis fuscata]